MRLPENTAWQVGVAMVLSEQQLRDDLKAAMRARDSLRTTALRAILAAIKNKTIEAKCETRSEADLIAIVKREVKQCVETLEFAREAGREGVVAEHEALLSVLEGYQPSQLDAAALKAAVSKIIDETGATEIGGVMRELNSRYPGQFDGKLASTLVRKALAG